MEKLQYKTECFEGPLDLLLHLIAKHKLNINDIPILELVEQYTAYVRKMQEEDLEVASEFLTMAARLVYIKTVSLLPVQTEAEELKKELTGELIEYQACKEAAAKLSENTDGFRLFTRDPAVIKWDQTYTRLHEPEDILRAYLHAAGKNLRRMPPPVDVFRKIVSTVVITVSEKISEIAEHLKASGRFSFGKYLAFSESRSELVAKFLAVLELCKSKQIVVIGDGSDFDVAPITQRVENGQTQ